MNTIKNITYFGLKNGNAEITFPSRLVAVVGANRSGKTSVRDALFLAINGSHPDHGKTNKAIMEMANGPDLSVDVTYSSGERFSRSWTTKKNGSVSLDSVIPQEWDESEITGLNVSNFLAMKGTERLKFLTGLADADDLKSVLISAFPEDNGIVDALGNEEDSHAALATMEKKAVENRRAAKQEGDRLKKALQEHSSSELPAQPDTGGVDRDGLKINIQALNDEIAVRDSGLRDLNEKAATIKTALENVTACGGRKKRISELSVRVKAGVNKEIEREQVLRAQSVKAAGDITAITQFNKELAAAQGDILSGEARSFLSDLVAKGEPVAPVDDLETLDKELSDAQRWFNETRSDIATLEETLDIFESETEAVLLADCCPTCLSKTKDFQSAFQKARDKEQSRLRSDLKAYLSKIDPLAKQVDGVLARQDAFHKATDLMGEFVKNSATLESDRLATAKIDNVNAAIDSLAVPLSMDEKQEQTALIERIAEHVRADKTLRELEAETDCDYSQSDLDGLAQQAEKEGEMIFQFNENKARLEAALVDLETLARFDAEKARLNESLTAAAGEIAECEKRVSAIKEATTKLLLMVWQPITKTVDVIVSKTFGKKVSCRVSGVDIGISDEKGFRPFRSLSGSERAVVAFGLSIAIASRSSLSVAFIDELNRLDTGNREKFLAACQFAIAKDLIGQIVVLDHNETGFTENEFSVIAC